jgi:hypothetical protein
MGLRACGCGGMNEDCPTCGGKGMLADGPPGASAGELGQSKKQSTASAARPLVPCPVCGSAVRRLQRHMRRCHAPHVVPPDASLGSGSHVHEDPSSATSSGPDKAPDASLSTSGTVTAPAMPHSRARVVSRRQPRVIVSPANATFCPICDTRVSHLHDHLTAFHKWVRCPACRRLVRSMKLHHKRHPECRARKAKKRFS